MINFKCWYLSYYGLQLFNNCYQAVFTPGCDSCYISFTADIIILCTRVQFFLYNRKERLIRRSLHLNFFFCCLPSLGYFFTFNGICLLDVEALLPLGLPTSQHSYGYHLKILSSQTTIPCNGEDFFISLRITQQFYLCVGKTQSSKESGIVA